MDQIQENGEKMTGDPAFNKDYIDLRCVLDALQVWALHYCLEDKHYNIRKQRKDAVVAALTPLIYQWGGKPAETAVSTPDDQAPSEGLNVPSGACGPGYYNCGGVCVPYECPEGTIL
jgi:hypothetical protein